MRTMLVATVLVVGAACAGVESPPPKESGEQRIEFSAGFGSDSDGLAPAWLGYAMARISGSPASRANTPSPDPAPFEEEVYARQSLALVWGELAIKNGYSNRYLRELVRVEAAGFIREYTWECVRSANAAAPSDLRLDAFRSWFSKALPNHLVETWTIVSGERGNVVVYVGQSAHEPYVCEPAP